MEIYSQIINILLIILLIVGIVLAGVLVRFMWHATLLVKALWADLTVLIDTLRTTNELTEQFKEKLQILNESLPVDGILSIIGSVMNLVINWRRGEKE